MGQSLETIAIIGNGPSGVHLVNELYRQHYAGRVLLFGEEPHAPYNRVKLSNFIDGTCDWNKLELSVSLRENWQAFYHTRIEHVDTANNNLTDNRSNKYHFDRLVFAMGSKPHIPAIPGSNLSGVFAFRNLDDAQQLISRQVSSRHTVVIGGGLLGIETARAMAKYSTAVTLIHHTPILMNRQLDEQASQLLVDGLAEQGVTVKLSSAVLAIDGARKVERVLLRGEKALPCDTVIFATGIRPNIELARNAGIAVGQGIKIDATLQTSTKQVFSIGECAEFNGRIFGLVAPGLEQAAVLAQRLANKDSDAHYQESLIASSLKVVSTPVMSAGEVGDTYEAAFYQAVIHEEPGIYRKLVLHRGRIVGAIGLGDWPESEEIKKAITRKRYFPLWRRWLFKKTGVIWQDTPNTGALPGTAIICNCRQVNAGIIRESISQGACTVEALGESCGAGTVCGSCQPLLAQFTTSDSVKNQSQWVLAGWSLLVIALLGGFYFLPPLDIATNYSRNSLDKWWTDTTYRQISGFTMLGLLSLGLMVGLRKRIKAFRWLKFATWRWFHVVLSTACLAILFLHTGMSAAQGLNQWLLYTFSAAVVLGILSAVLTHIESLQPGILSKSVKRWLTTAHLVSFWPLPALLGFHVLSVYWF